MSRRIPLLNVSIGGLFARIALLSIVIVWTVPTFGLLISSLRDKDQLAISGWWTALQSVSANGRARTANSDGQVERDGIWWISGSVIAESDNRAITSFGGGFLGGELTTHQAGETVQLENGETFTLNANGQYTWSSPIPFDLTSGKSFYYVSQNSPRFTLDNYREILSISGVGQSFVNTLMVTLPSVLIATTVAAFAAYGFSWMHFPKRKFLLLTIIALQVVPLQMSLIPVLRMYNELGIGKTYPGIWIAHTGFGLPLAIFLISNYMRGLPGEVMESAKIDGASDFQIFTRIAIPLSIPALAAYATFEFLWVWNDLLVALVFLSQHPDQIVLTSKLRELLGSQGENWEVLTSSAFVSLIVPLLVFFALQRYFVKGLTAGSVKG